jgi:CRP-like cAMP-binding protein/Zn-dependent protease
VKRTSRPGEGPYDRLRTAIREPSQTDSESGVWALLESRMDPGAWRPKLAADIEVRDFTTRWGKTYTMIANPRDLIHYRLESADAEIVKLLDGERTLKQLVIERFRDSGEIDVNGAARLVRELEAGNFFDRPYVDTDAAVRRAIDPASVRRHKARQFARTLTVEWSGADRIVGWLYDHGVKVFFRRSMVVACTVLSVVGVLAFLELVASGRFSLTGPSLALGMLLLLFLDYLMVFVHEVGHASVLKHHGRRIKSAGFQIYFGSPAFFVDSSESLMLGRRVEISASLAGPYAQMIVGAVASVVALLLPDWTLSLTLYRFAVLNYFVVFMNLIPLLELDGYYVLADLIEVPDLRPRSLAFVQRDLWHKLRAREHLSRQEAGLALYGTAGVLFTVFSFATSYFYWRALFGNFVSRLWNGGPLLRALLIVLGLFVAGPLVRGLGRLLRATAARARLVWNRVKFRLESRWRVEAALLIDALPLFDDVPQDILSDLAGRVSLRTFPSGRSVVRQGERATAFFVVRKGRLRVVEEDSDAGEERTLRILGPGDSFGEVGLVETAPRAATVRTIEPSELFEINKGTFDRLLADMANVPSFEPTLQRLLELQALPCFAMLGADELAALEASGEWMNISPGSLVIREGEEGDTFFAVGSGRLRVVKDGRELRTIGPGAHFGEIALLLDVPRTATVEAITPVRVFCLGRPGFDRLVADAFRDRVIDPAVSIDEVWQH